MFHNEGKNSHANILYKQTQSNGVYLVYFTSFVLGHWTFFYLIVELIVRIIQNIIKENVINFLM